MIRGRRYVFDSHRLLPIEASELLRTLRRLAIGHRHHLHHPASRRFLSLRTTVLRTRVVGVCGKEASLGRCRDDGGRRVDVPPCHPAKGPRERRDPPLSNLRWICGRGVKGLRGTSVRGDPRYRRLAGRKDRISNGIMACFPPPAPWKDEPPSAGHPESLQAEHRLPSRPKGSD